MRRGTRVGQAYVAVTADGSGINEEIVHSVDEAGDGIEKKGDEHGERYGEHFGEGLRVKFSHAGDKAGEELARRLAAEGDVAGDDFGHRMGNRLDSQGDRIGHSLGKKISASLSDELEVSIGRMIDLLENRLIDAVSGNRGGGASGGGGTTLGGSAANLGPPPIEQRRLEAAYREDRAFDRARTRVLASAHAMDVALDKKRTLEVISAHRMNEIFDRKRTIELITAHRMNELFNRGRLSGEGRAITSGGGGSRGKDTGLTSLDDWLNGTHSRNNAINLIAKALGGLVHGFESIAQASKNFVDNMKNVEEGASIFEKISAGFGSGGAEGAGLFSKIAAAGPAAIAGIVAVGLAMTVLISVVNALLAIVAALAATIVSALVGALAVGAAGLAALGAAAGLATLAFMSMTDQQQKALATAFKPLHEEAVGLGQVMLKDMVPAFAQWSKHLQEALGLMQPLAEVMGGAFAKAGNILTSSLSGPGFRLFFDALAKDLPRITTNLSRALGGALNGLSGMFAAILPDVLRFSRYLSDVASRFAAWATSASGQNAIKDFVGRALDALHSLWSFLGAVGGLLSQVLFSPQGQQAGNSIFDSLTGKIREFTQFLKDNPNKLQDWFDNGVTFAKALGDTIVSLTRTLQALNQSGVINAIAFSLRVMAAQVKLIGDSAKIMAAVLIGAFGLVVLSLEGLLRGTAAAVGALANIPVIGDKFKGVAKNVSAAADNVAGFGKSLKKIAQNIVISVNADTTPAADALNRLIRQTRSLHISVPVTASTNATIGEAVTIGHTGAPPTTTSSINTSALQSSGANALANTSIAAGGTKPKPKYHNPYVAFANQLIKDGPSVAAQIKNAILAVNKQAQAAIADATRAASADAVKNSLADLVSSLTTSAEETVNTAQSALNSAAQSLASATSKSAAKRALARVKQTQRDLAAAIRDQARIQAAAKIVAAQEIVTSSNVTALLSGFSVMNATLADYAEARSQIVDLLQTANQKLADAINLRDQYKTAISDSIKSFAALVTAQAQTIDGVQQALTANDITTNLQSKLTQIQTFQNNLKLLLAEGLSNDAYKQIVDAGVEAGGAIATGLLQGGTGAIQNVNSLVGQINGIADTLGSETSDRLYQAGVDAAQGLVDGLTSLSAQLDAAATALGQSIAASLKAALGIASPSKVMIEAMNHVGDGLVLGLNAQQVRVGNAASRLSSQVAVSPEVAAYAAQQGRRPDQYQQGGVSGNGSGQKFRDLIVHTPTENPTAVAHEVLNEVIGRL